MPDPQPGTATAVVSKDAYTAVRLGIEGHSLVAVVPLVKPQEGEPLLMTWRRRPGGPARSRARRGGKEGYRATRGRQKRDPSSSERTVSQRHSSKCFLGWFR